MALIASIYIQYPLAKFDFVWKPRCTTQQDMRRIFDGEMVLVVVCSVSVMVGRQVRIPPSVVWWRAHATTVPLTDSVTQQLIFRRSETNRGVHVATACKTLVYDRSTPCCSFDFSDRAGVQIYERSMIFDA